MIVEEASYGSSTRRSHGHQRIDYLSRNDAHDLSGCFQSRILGRYPENQSDCMEPSLSKTSLKNEGKGQCEEYAWHGRFNNR